ncbi:MAG: T9SS type A sorting domain-containing protein [candidate division Zixibacteria bacterium]|nr:T9SS type A sorting domain-containing protein [candidate division Zixibacteria bacterium]
MKALLTVLVMIPIMCFGAADLVFDVGVESSAEVISSDEFKTSMRLSLSSLARESISYEDKTYSRIIPPESGLINFGYINEEGMPDLPLYAETVIIPDQSGVRVNIISADYQIIPDIDIAPVQPMEVEGKDDPIPFTISREAYSRDEFYPGDLASVGEPAIFKDFRVIDVCVYPVQYNPVSREMRVYTNIEYELVYEGYDNRNVKVRNNNNISEAFLPLYRDYLANADEVLTDYEPQRGGYLIFSAYSCTTKAKELAEWKHRKGFDVQLISTSEFGGNPSYVQVKNAIQDAYDESDPKIEYVAIIGDMNGSGYKVATNTYDGDATDHPYSMLEGSDYEPDVIVSRLSVSNVNNLNTVMAKTLRYEQDPYMSDPLYYKRGLSCAGPYGSTSPRLMACWVRQTMLDHGYIAADTVIDATGGSYYTQRVSSLINDGVSLVTYRGWGGSSGWSYPSYHTDNIGSLSNGWKIGIMASIVCGTGNFGATECFNECWIRVGSPTTPKGGVGAFGPTDFWTHTRWNNTILMGLASALIERDTYNLGAVLIAGKLNAHKSFPHVPGYHGWQWYYHIYNCLGDPELAIRTDTPKTMTASYNDDIPVGTNYLDIHVVAETGGPLEGAYVCLVKGEGAGEEVFVGGWTDGSGDVTFEFNTSTSDSMHVTISYRNYIPHQGICMVNSQSCMVAFNNLELVNDDAANPTETLDLEVKLQNFGVSETATNVIGEITSDNPAVQIITGTIDYPDVPAGEIRDSEDYFTIELDGDIPHDEILVLPLTVTTDQGTYESCAFIQVKSSLFSYTGHDFPDGGDNLDPGETVSMVVDLDNIGDLDGVDLTGVLSCDDPFIWVTDNTASFGTINACESGSNSEDYFSVHADAAAYDGRNLNFELQLTSSDGVVSRALFNIVLGEVDQYTVVGPDNYGYYMYENIDIGYDDLIPEYDWVAINSIGDRLTFYSNDDGSALVEMPFDFVYYGDTYTHIIVSTNGFIAVDTAETWPGHYHHNWDNYPIPDPGCARGQISPFWDDLTTSSGGIYKYYDTDNHRFIIEWYNNRHTNTNATETFEVIIYDPEYHETQTGDAEIVFQYYTITNNDNSQSDPNHPEAYSSIGFENWDEDDGIQYEWRNIYHPGAATIANGRAIKITTNGESTVDIDNPTDNLPGEFKLMQNNPNPFNATTTLGYSLSKTSWVTFQVYDILGRQIITLVDRMQSAGHHQAIWNAENSPSGVYFYKIQAGENSETRKMMLLK